MKTERIAGGLVAVLFKTICLSLTVIACSPLVQEANRIAKTCDNREIGSFLTYYKEQHDREKFKAACFLVANMPGKYSISADTGEKKYDVDIVKADSLIYSLEQSFIIWKNSPYSSRYGFYDFCKYILPYRVANEPLTYYWKEDCRRWLDVVLSENIEETAEAVNNYIRIGIIPANIKADMKSYTELVESGYGKCEDRAVMLAMALRSLGIPAAYEFVPFWGSNNNGHAFVSVINPDGTVYPLANTDDAGRKTYLSRKTPKIFRKTYSINKMPHNEAGGIPLLFQDNDIEDVTALHNIGMKDIKVKIEGDVYLAVFSPDGWVPVTYGRKCQFDNVGTGVNATGNQENEAVDLGDGILYLPVTVADEMIVPVAHPIIVSQSGLRDVVADTSNIGSVTLNRKYPLNTRIVGFAKSMTNGIFEGADNPDFSDAVILYEISGIPESRMQKVRITDDRPYRYIRYRRPAGIFSIAEIKLYGSDGKEIVFRPMACKPLENIPEQMDKVFDNDPLTYFEISGGISLWIGADLGKPMTVSEIAFAPRNDDNAVSPGDVYELFYWNGKWESIGMKQADDYTITFTDVPQNALLWLRDLTRGCEERPFTYEKGKQIWW